jgi:perosamine synthetase
MYVPAWPGLSPLRLAARPGGGPLPYPLEAPGRILFYLARSGIYHATRALLPAPGAVALAPDYHNGLEVLALRAAGARPRFFRVDARLEPDLDDIRRGLAEGARLVLVIHYNGWPQPIEEIVSLCREHGAALLEDCALSFLSDHEGTPLGTFGDASVFCLYKTLPVPNGAVLAMNGQPGHERPALELRNPGPLSTAARTAELGISWVRSRSEHAGAALARAKSWAGSVLSAARLHREPVGAMTFDESVLDIAMDPWATRLLTRFDYAAIREGRRANYGRLCAALQGRSTPLLSSLPNGVCPLFFPLLVTDKRSAVRALASRGVEAVEFWNAGDPDAEGERFGKAMALRRHVIELPIHQDLTAAHVDHVARSVIELGLGIERRP